MRNELTFSEHLVGDGYGYAYGICAADIDGDGRLDIVSADAHVGLYWYANDGKGAFTKYVIQYCPRTRLERMACADLTGNGFPDIVIVDNIHGDILLFENRGTPRDGRPWPCRYLAGPQSDITRGPEPGAMPFAYDVAIADLDGDGRLDVAATGWVGNEVAWFRNTGADWVKYSVETDIAETRTIRVADLNGNGLPDLLLTASTAGQVIWYENPGDPVNRPWRKHVIAEQLRPIHGHPVDMTGNGRADVVMACGAFDTDDARAAQEIVWYENTGDPEETPWPRHVITTGFEGAFEAVAADLDGDGQTEVVATAWRSGTLAVFRHAGDPRGPWSRQVLKADWAKVNQVVVADLDGDGRLDIIACAERGSNEVRWWRNEC